MLIYLMLAAVSSVAAVGIYQTLHVQIQQSSTIAANAQGRRAAVNCCEYAVARVIADPGLRGTIPVTLAGHPAGSVTITRVGGGDLDVVATVITGGTAYSHSYTLKSSDLRQTRTEMGL